MRKKWLLISLLVVALAGFTLAATTWDQTFARFTNIWVGVTGDTPSYTLGSNSAYVKGDVEVDGTLYADGNLYLGGGLYPSGTAAVRSFDLPLREAWCSSPGSPIGKYDVADTSPAIGTTDGVIAIIYKNTTDDGTISFSFMVPPDYSSGLAFRMLISSNRPTTADGTSTAGFGWALWVNNDGGVMDEAPDRQASIVPTAGLTSLQSWDTTNVFWDFTPNTTALAKISAGSVIGIDIHNTDSRRSSAGLTTQEIKRIQVRYTATY